MEKEVISEIIRSDQGVNSDVNHNLIPPRAETTTHFYRMREYKRRQTQSNIDIGEFVR